MKDTWEKGTTNILRILKEAVEAEDFKMRLTDSFQ